MSRSSHALLIAALLAGGVVGLSASPAEASGGDAHAAVEAMTGSYRYVGSGKQRRARERSLLESVAVMNPLYQQIAERRLRRNNPISPRLRLVEEDGVVVVVTPDARPMRAPIDGRPQTWVNRDGTAMSLRHRMRAGRLVQEIRGTHGTKRVVYSLDRSGSTLTVKTSITSKHLPKPIEYRLSYRGGD
jgi:hypothetical protein